MTRHGANSHPPSKEWVDFLVDINFDSTLVATWIDATRYDNYDLGCV